MGIFFDFFVLKICTNLTFSVILKLNLTVVQIVYFLAREMSFCHIFFLLEVQENIALTTSGTKMFAVVVTLPPVGVK